jgi:hypothetical protein
VSRGVSWFLLLVIVGLTSYIAIDKFGTPSVQVVEYAPAPSAVPAAPVQPEQSTAQARGWQQPPVVQQGAQTTSTPTQTPSLPPQQSQLISDDFQQASGGVGEDTLSSQASTDAARARMQAASQMQEQQRRIAEMREIQSELTQLMQDPNNIEIDDLAMIINRLEESQGTSVIGGIDMGVMRSNLEYASRMQALGEEMNAAVQRGAGEEELRQFAEQMEELQGSLSLPNFPSPPQ